MTRKCINVESEYMNRK